MSNFNYRELWQEAMKIIRQEYTMQGDESDFNLWFKMDYLEDSGNEIFVSSPSEFLWSQMEKKGYTKKIISELKKLSGQTEITLSPKFVQEKIETNEIENITNTQKIEKKTDEKTQKKPHPQLRSDFTFETFISGDNSSFAYNASIAVAKEPGKKYNPILLYGGVGLGKTHLMQAIGNYVHEHTNEKYKICYVSAESFTNEFTASLANKTVDKFKSKYRNLDLLLVDDIHFFQNKEATQDELFYTFNALRDKNSQIVFTCDRPINDLKGFADRIQTRISNGLCIDLQPPRYETRKAILIKKLELLHQTIPEEIIDYIAKNIETNVRDLESALTKMIGYVELIQKPLTIEIAQEQLRDVFSNPPAGSISIENIQKAVADSYNISVSDLKSKKRNQKIVIPRQIAIYITRELTEYAFTEIGSEFGGRDHSTIMHSYEKISNDIKIDSSLHAKIDLIIKDIKEKK